MFEATIMIIAVMIFISIFTGLALYGDWKERKNAVQ